MTELLVFFVFHGPVNIFNSFKCELGGQKDGLALTSSSRARQG